MGHQNFECAKCPCRGCKIGEVRTVGVFSSKIFDMPNPNLSIVTCRRCRYTQPHVADGSKFGNIFELLTQ